jgi:hypothetical protein
MKTMAILTATIALAGVLGTSNSLAQGGPRGGGWGPGSRYGRMYNPQTVENISGEVVKVERVAPMGGMGRGVHLLVKTNNETISVHLGPSWFIDNQEIRIEPKDHVEITGSRVMLDGKPAIIASEVREGDEVLRLRDANGIPIWAGWRQRGAGAATEPGSAIAGGGMMGPEMMARHKEMIQEHQKMMVEMKAMDAELDKRVAQMNEAQGSAKVDAMAAVINQLIKEHQVMHQRMTAMQERMMTHMRRMQNRMDGMQPGMGGTDTPSDSEPGKE